MTAMRRELRPDASTSRAPLVAAGFAPVEMSALRPHDVILLRVAAPVPNHAAIYLGDQVMLHHLQGRLSSRDVYGGWWLQNTTHYLRHKDLA